MQRSDGFVMTCIVFVQLLGLRESCLWEKLMQAIKLVFVNYPQ